jgi:hypothetical protein
VSCAHRLIFAGGGREGDDGANEMTRYDTSTVFGQPVNGNIDVSPKDGNCPGYTWVGGVQPANKQPHDCG